MVTSLGTKVLLVVRGVVVNSEGKVLLIRRSSKEEYASGYWEVPGGKVDEFQDINFTIEREVLEETGLLVKLVDHGMFVDSTMLGTGKYSGLAYINMAGMVRVNGGKVVLGDEHDKYRWVSMEDALKMNLTIVTRKCLSFFQNKLGAY